MKLATLSQRFVSFIIDILLIAFVVSIALAIAKGLAPERPSFPTSAMSETLLDFYNKNTSNFSNRVMIAYLQGDTQIYEDYKAFVQSSEYIAYSQEMSRINALITIPAIATGIVSVFIYLCIIPVYWSKQTVGRWFMKIKVIRRDIQTPTFLQFLLREFIGETVTVFSNAFLALGIILNSVFITSRHLSIADMVSSTVVVSTELEMKVEIVE